MNSNIKTYKTYKRKVNFESSNSKRLCNDHKLNNLKSGFENNDRIGNGIFSKIDSSKKLNYKKNDTKINEKKSKCEVLINNTTKKPNLIEGYFIKQNKNIPNNKQEVIVEIDNADFLKKVKILKSNKGNLKV